MIFADERGGGNKAGGPALWLVSLLIFVLPIPGVIAIRYAIMLALLVVLVRGYEKQQQFFPPRWVGIVLGGLSAWLLLQALFVSGETAWALRELKGQWLPAMMAFICGVLLVAKVLDGRRLISVVMLALFIQLCFSLVVCIPHALKYGVFPEGETSWTAGKLEISYLNNLLLAFITVDLIGRFFHRLRLSLLPMPLLGLGLVLAIVSNLAFGARNGVIASIMLILSLCLVVLIRQWQRNYRRQVVFGLLVSVAVVTAVTVFNWRTDARWQKFPESIRIAWDIDHNRAWLDERRYPMPTLTDGSSVDASAYLRVAWIHAGLRLLEAHPLGVGYGRNAFGHALRQAESSPVGHSHSGMIDLGVGAGIPGLLLWFALLGGAAWEGLRQYVRRQSPIGLVLFFATTGFLGRMALDSINRDHMLVMFFLILGILLCGLATENIADNAEPARR